jgi:hypothetical protein
LSSRYVSFATKPDIQSYRLLLGHVFSHLAIVFSAAVKHRKDNRNTPTCKPLLKAGEER